MEQRAITMMTLRSPAGEERTVRVEKAEGEDLGLDFETYLMDAPRACSITCISSLSPVEPKQVSAWRMFTIHASR